MRTLSMAILQHGDNKELYAVPGSIYLEQGQPSEALRDLVKALKLAPEPNHLFPMLLLALHKNNASDAYVIVLFDQYAAVKPEINAALGSLKFK